MSKRIFQFILSLCVILAIVLVFFLIGSGKKTDRWTGFYFPYAADDLERIKLERVEGSKYQHIKSETGEFETWKECQAWAFKIRTTSKRNESLPEDLFECVEGCATSPWNNSTSCKGQRIRSTFE